MQIKGSYSGKNRATVFMKNKHINFVLEEEIILKTKDDVK
jgi:hypothetical protein